MPVLQFKGKTAIESYHHIVPHHTLEFDSKLSVLEKGDKPGLDGNLIIEGDNLLALKALLPTHAQKIKCIKEIRNKIPAGDESLAVYRNPNNDPKGRWRPVPLTAQAGHATPDQFYKIVTPTRKVHTPPPGRCWGITEPQYKKLLKEGDSIGLSKRGRTWFGTKGDSQPNLIRYLSEVEGFVPWTWWPHDEAGNTDESKKEILEIFGYDAFPSPKPTRLIKRIIEMYTNPESNDIILDSFAGSGTTAHAVLALNAEDESNRKFILIQIPFDTKDNEKQGLNICQKITAERVRRVIKGYQYEGVKEEVLLSRNLTLSALKNPHEILEEIDLAKKEHEPKFDEIVTQAEGGKVRLVAKRNITGKTESLHGCFTYVKLGPALLGEYRTLGEEFPLRGTREIHLLHRN